MLSARLFAVALLLPPTLALTQSTPRRPVLIELFTSEGCSSCPPADALVARLDHDQPIPTADVIVLGEHVDYWDSLGWHDRFSSASATARQVKYAARFGTADVYTPQLVVAGREQVLGSDASAAARAIVRAAQSPDLPLEVTGLTLRDHRIYGTVHLTSQSPIEPRADLFVALVTPMASTPVRAGENAGQTLRHTGVVRSLSRIGNGIDLRTGPVNFQAELPPETTRDSQPLRVIVFAQTHDLGPILGAIALPAPASPQATTAALR
jgi:hypothetical protein